MRVPTLVFYVIQRTIVQINPSWQTHPGREVAEAYNKSSNLTAKFNMVINIHNHDYMLRSKRELKDSLGIERRWKMGFVNKAGREKGIEETEGEIRGW